MSGHDDQLDARLMRLERSMPDALPIDLAEAVAVERPRRMEGAFAWPTSALLLLGAVVAGMLVGGSGLLLLAPRPSAAPVLPAGLYRSATPVADPVCVALELPVRAAERLEQRRVWWWPRGPKGCGQRSDFIYVQWVQPTRAPITAAEGTARNGIRLALVVELRDGSRHDVDLVLDPMAEAAADGSVVTYAAGGSAPGVTLVPIDDYDELEEVAP